MPVPTKEKQKAVITRVVKEVKNYLGEKLDKIILFGSYARGDYDEHSDIDIMVLADIEPDETPKYRNGIFEISHNIGFKNDILVSLMIKSSKFFNANLQTLGFYKNIIREGKLLYGFDGKRS